MELPRGWISVLKDLVHELVIGNYLQLELDGRAGRLTAEELHQAVTQYGRKLTDPPDQSFQGADIYPVKGKENSSWAIDLDLWTIEEGHSDLTLSLTLHVIHDNISVYIDDLHVL